MKAILAMCGLIVALVMIYFAAAWFSVPADPKSHPFSY
jgi:hypothetical protein